MALLSLSNLEKSFGAREVLRGLSLSIERGDKLGLIGPNGCGKTTLLRIIAGREQADRGELHWARGVMTAWLEQTPDLAGERTALEEARTALADLAELERRLSEWRHKIAGAPDHKLSTAEQETYARDEAEFNARAGHDRERRLQVALQKLGLEGPLLEQKFSALSGGERTRLALAKLLVSPFDLLVLDEPTNHLDVQGIEWLQEALLESAQTFIVVSHDRAFLDAVVNKVAEFNAGKLVLVNGNYTQFITVKAERLKAQQRSADLEARFIAKEMEFIRRYMAGQRSREAKGRLKRLQRREAAWTPKREHSFEVKLKAGRAHADVVLSVIGLGKKIGERTLFENLDFELWRGEKLGIVGPNGSGKTTLSKILLGEWQPTAGKLRLAPQLKTGAFTQDLGFLRPDRTILEEYGRLARPANLNAARGPLGAFLFGGDRVYQRMENLSGGERARLALCILVSKESDVLFMDEPTNHLDIPSRQALEEALAAFPGACLIISHDRRFLDRITQRTLWLDGPRTRLYGASYTEAREERMLESQPPAEALPGDPQRRRPAPLPPKARKINEFKLNAIEAELSKLEARRKLLINSRYEGNIFRDHVRMRAIAEELDLIERRLLELNREWETLVDAASS